MALGMPSTIGSDEPTLVDTMSQLLARGGSSFSFEFFPPKDDAGEAALWASIRRLEPLAPTFVSVTYGAGGTTRDRTVRITGRIATETTLTPVAHLTCVSAPRSELRRVVGEYAAAGVHNILALRGDPPGGPGAEWVPHPNGLTHAVELVELVRSLGRFSVGVAAFPYRHPESPDLDHDARVLAMKADAGAEFAITQLFFDSSAYFSLLERAERHGARIPVIPGLMPITSMSQIERFALLGGTPVPEPLIRRLHAVADDPKAVRQVGMDAVTELAQQLLDGGAPGLHFYTLNRSTATLEVYRALGLHARGSHQPAAR
ncbi:MAG: methylenetetrahydrofolate reductase [NAD(P)H] [Actinomycetes bacterium]